MIKPKQIPKKVVRAAEKAWEKDTESFRPNAKTIAAALNAWPGISKVGEVYGLQQEWWLELPLKEASDEPHP
jgi:hypothetical protein